MDNTPTIAGVKLEALPDTDMLSATVVVHFGGPDKSVTFHGVPVPEKAKERAEGVAIAEAQRLARSFAGDASLALDYGK